MAQAPTRMLRGGMGLDAQQVPTKLGGGARWVTSLENRNWKILIPLKMAANDKSN